MRMQAASPSLQQRMTGIGGKTAGALRGLSEAATLA
jgi:hypothetical protein